MLKRCAATAIIALALAMASVPASSQAVPAPASHPVPTGAPDGSPELSRLQLARIDTVMQAAIDSARTAGIAVLVLHRGVVVKSGTYGWADREAGTRLELDALFRIASQTKAVTSVAAMMLVERGRLRLADPVHRWMPGFDSLKVVTDSGLVPLRRPITIRDLLTHTAGLSYGGEAGIRELYQAEGLGPAAGGGWYFADKPEPICASMDRLARLPLVAQPGERFVYGYATDVLGCIIERVSGQPLDAFFRDHIFVPLGMHDTHFFVPEAERQRLTVLYAAGPEGLQRAADDARGQGAYVDGPCASFSGGAGLVSTIGDYARLLQMLLNGGELDGVRILSPHTVAMMTTDHLGPVYDLPGLGFGLGFQVLEEPGLAARYGAPGAYGWGGAYATTYWVDPAERIVGMIFTQTLPSGGLDIADRFRAMVYSALTLPSVRRYD
jgi:CubicO group peptidase (beta-lactamase class C family)